MPNEVPRSLRVVVDANVVAAALVRPGGWTDRELDRDDVIWLAPSYLVKELRAHAAELAERAGCPRSEWTGRVRRLQRRLETVPDEASVQVAED